MPFANSVTHRNRPLERELGWSAVVKARGLLFLAGIAAVDDDNNAVSPGDFEAQVNFIYDQVEDALKLEGASLENVVQEIWFFTDLDGMQQRGWPARAARYGDFEFPATAGSQIVKLDTPGAVAEVIVTAVAPD